MSSMKAAEGVEASAVLSAQSPRGRGSVELEHTAAFPVPLDPCTLHLSFGKSSAQVLIELVETGADDVTDRVQTCACTRPLHPSASELHGAPQRGALRPDPKRRLRSGARIAVQREHPHGDALLRKAGLLLLAQHLQPALPDEAPEDVHVPSHAAVREI